MSCIGKIVLLVAILAVSLQAAPVAKREVSHKFFPASCPSARTGKYLVVLEYVVYQPGSSQQKEAPSFVLKKYMDTHMAKEDDSVKEEEPTKADTLNQVVVSTSTSSAAQVPTGTPAPSPTSSGVAPTTTPLPTPDAGSDASKKAGDDDKQAKVKSYSTLIAELMYHVDMNDPALKDILNMSGVAFVEEEMSVFGANCGGGDFGGDFGSQEDNEPEPTEEDSEEDDSQQPMMMMMG